MTQTDWYARCQSPEYQNAAHIKWLQQCEREDSHVWKILCPQCLEIESASVKLLRERRERGIDPQYCLSCGCGLRRFWAGKQWVSRTCKEDRLWGSPRVLEFIAANQQHFPYPY